MNVGVRWLLHKVYSQPCIEWLKNAWYVSTITIDITWCTRKWCPYHVISGSQIFEDLWWGKIEVDHLLGWSTIVGWAVVDIGLSPTLFSLLSHIYIVHLKVHDWKTAEITADIITRFSTCLYALYASCIYSSLHACSPNVGNTLADLSMLNLRNSLWSLCSTFIWEENSQEKFWQLFFENSWIIYFIVWCRTSFVH